jgi:hypothetical protein
MGSSRRVFPVRNQRTDERGAKDMKKLFAGVAAAAIGLLASNLALANTTSPNAPIAGVGVGNTATFVNMSTMPAGCNWGGYFIDTTIGNDVQIARMTSAAMAAYLAGKKITRIDYNQVGDKCMATFILF